ncbi:MAG: peptidoglycan bridge formation glycyltransferase FemA/FemB family protein [bacterium]|nr:peptidoglycan bridge formation glycyltransferase FemA/FemB family protein [bacterium]
MVIQRLTEKDREKFNKSVFHPIQSWEWGEFREKTGNKVVRLLGGYQLTVHPIPYTNFKLAVFLKGPAPTKEMLNTLREFAKEEGIIFIRMEPNVAVQQNIEHRTKNKGELERLLIENGARRGRPFFTKSTFIIDLTKSEEELSKAMHPKTRYNIRVAQRHGVAVLEDNSKKAFETYLRLTDETTKRQGFYAHTEKYHRLMWETLHQQIAGSGQAPIARLLTAKYKGEILITWVLFVFKDTLYYPYGASSDEHRGAMASYAMMWEAIKFGKKLGLKKFDLWGREEGKGFTKFKEGFAPEVVEFLGTWDLVINPTLYPIYRIAEEIRWKILKAKAHFLPASSFR